MSDKKVINVSARVNVFLILKNFLSEINITFAGDKGRVFLSLKDIVVWR